MLFQVLVILCLSGTDVCNFRRSVHVATSQFPLPSPFVTGCDLPDDTLSELYGNASVPVEFVIRPPGGSGFGLISDTDTLWRSDSVDESHVTRAKAYVQQILEFIPPWNGLGNSGVTGLVTHGETIDAIYKAVGVNAGYNPGNTQVVPLVIEFD
jgi:hypothetical protein